MSPQLSVNFNITLTWLWSYILLSCTCLNLCPGLNASTVELVLDIWQGYFTFSHYFIFDRTGCVLVTFYQWEHFVMFIIRNLYLISIQSWTYTHVSCVLYFKTHWKNVCYTKDTWITWDKHETKKTGHYLTIFIEIQLHCWLPFNRKMCEWPWDHLCVNKQSYKYSVHTLLRNKFPGIFVN